MGYVINPNTKKISLTRGDTFRVQVEIVSDGVVYTPTENDSIRFSMKRSYGSNTVLIHKDIPSDTMVLTLSPEDTKNLAFGLYVYDMEITFENGDVFTFISGWLDLLPEVE